MSLLYNGLILVDKPSCLSSNGVVQKIRRLLNKVKAGHTGSLDPLASGMLPIALGEATKFCQYLLEADKCYRVTARLGMTTSTGDSMGDILTSFSGNISVDATKIKKILPDFTGNIYQVPPMISALKYRGQPLYKLARKGIIIDRPAREINIQELVLEDVSADTFSLMVRCSKGTYIRTLIEDLGQRLEVGAHVVKLRREYTAGFEAAEMLTLEALSEMSVDEINKAILPIDSMVYHFARLEISKDILTGLSLGKTMALTGIDSHSGVVRLYDTDSKKFLGLGEWLSPQELKVKRLIHT